MARDRMHAAEFLGVGMSFPVMRVSAPGAGGTHFELAEYEESVRQSILIILQTSKGERVMRPTFGCGLQDLIFAVKGSAVLGLAEHEVGEALRTWEPRIDVLSVRAAHAGEDEEGIVVDIDYRVRATDSRLNLVFPFFLERSVI
jgi:uncharacterized protein